MRELYARYGYGEVITPQILDVELWKTSGHYANYGENMFFTEVGRAADGGQADELPDALPDLRAPGCARTATCRSATPTSAGSTATSAAA